MEKFQWPAPQENGAIGFVYCGFCRNKVMVYKQLTLAEFMEANGLGPEDMGTKSDWLPGGVYM